MKEAIEDHKASSDHEPRSIYGKRVAEADRMIDTEITFRRTIQYRLKQNFSADKEWHYNCFHEHLLNKYPQRGYLKRYRRHSFSCNSFKNPREIDKSSRSLKGG